MILVIDLMFVNYKKTKVRVVMVISQHYASKMRQTHGRN